MVCSSGQDCGTVQGPVSTNFKARSTIFCHLSQSNDEYGNVWIFIHQKFTRGFGSNCETNILSLHYDRYLVYQSPPEILGVSVSICFVQKNSPRLWYTYLVGETYSLNSRIETLIAVLSGSVLYSARVISYNASEAKPQMKSSCLSLFFRPTGLCHSGSPDQFCYVYLVFSLRLLRKFFKPLFRCVYLLSSVLASKFGVSSVMFLVSVK